MLLHALGEQLDGVCVWSNPPGGLFVWLRLPDDVDRRKLYGLCQSRGFSYLPGASFHFETNDVPYLRLAFGHLTLEQISDGVPVSGALHC